MAQQHINVGSAPNDGTGDALRVSQQKAESNFNELYSLKVDKLAGKQLSDENFTLAEKTKLAGLVEGGQIQSDWDQGDNTEVDYIKNKPTNVSEFFNDAGYVTVVNYFPKIQFTADGTQDTFDLLTTALARTVFYNGALLDDADWDQSETNLILTFVPDVGAIIKPI